MGFGEGERLNFMGNLAREVKMESVSVDGLEEIFVGEDTSGQDTIEAEDRTPLDNAISKDSTGQDICEAWTVDEAAAHLGISSKTVLRRLQKGTLSGHKVPGQFGMEWRVAKDRTPLITPPAQDRTTQDSVELIQLRTKVEVMASELNNLREQLQGASYRNGYLSAQIEGRNAEIKLLMDSQKKKSAWTRFWVWFTGQT